MTKSRYDGISIDDKLSERDLECHNKHIYNNSLVAVPTGKKSANGDNEYIIKPLEFLTGSTNKPSIINGKPQGTVFGVDIVAAHRAVAVSTKWDLGIPLKSLNYEINGSAYLQCTLTEETAELGTGTDADAEIKIWSDKMVRYGPGNPLFLNYTLAMPKKEDSNGDYTVAFGFYDTFNGLLHAQRRRDNLLEYGFILVRDAVEEWFPLNGVDFPVESDTNDLNIFYMDGGYLGVAPTNIYLSDADYEIFKRLHRQLYKQRITNVKTPDLPIGGFVRNEGNTMDIKILNGSVSAGTINGNQEQDPSLRTKTYSITKTIPTNSVNVSLVSFLNPNQVDMYDRIDATLVPRIRDYTNTISSKLVEVEGRLDGQNKSGVVDLYLTKEDDIISGLFTPVDLGFSVLKVSDNAVVDLGNSELLESFTFGSAVDILPKLITTLDLLGPGKVATFVVTSASVSFDIRWKIVYQDRF